MTKYLSDFENCGFKAADIFTFLKKHGIEIDLPVGNAEGELTMQEQIPGWKKIMSLQAHLSYKEAAAAFAGIDLIGPGWLSDEAGAELSRWENVLRSAIRSGELLADEVDWDRDGRVGRSAVDWRISPADLAAWCVKKGVPYPLPIAESLPQTDAGLRSAYAQSESERAQLKSRIAEFESVRDVNSNLQGEINFLRGELREIQDKFAILVTDRDKLKEDLLLGKAKSTMLKIVGGVVAANYKIDIHRERLEGIGAVVRDLQTVGAAVTEKTLRAVIREAAPLVEKRTKRE